MTKYILLEGKLELVALRKADAAELKGAVKFSALITTIAIAKLMPVSECIRCKSVTY
jgi:hypothetical protein